MASKHPRILTTRIFTTHIGVEMRRVKETRTTYMDKATGKRYVKSMGKMYLLNNDNEWKQPVEDTLRGI